jgi:hypothetical protein
MVFRKNRYPNDCMNEKVLPEIPASYEFIIPANTSFNKKVYRGAAEGSRGSRRQSLNKIYQIPAPCSFIKAQSLEEVPA